MSQLVYPILDMDTCRARGLNPEHVPEVWMELGLYAFQLRWKNARPAEYTDFARSLKKRFGKALLIANDYASLAAGPPFAMVHVGQEDLAEQLPAIQKHSIPFGISTHNALQMKAALALRPAPGYVALGPVRETSSKPGGTDPVLSQEELGEAVNSFQKSGAPALVLIGGIHAENVRDIIAPISERGLVPAVSVIQAALDPSGLAALLTLMQGFPGRSAGISPIERSLTGHGET